MKNESRTYTAVKKSLYPLPSRGLWFCLQVEFIFKYTTFKVQKEKLPNIFEKYKEIVRTMTKKERERQIKKAYIFYRRRVRTLLATGRYLLTIDYRKKDINNEK